MTPFVHLRVHSAYSLLEGAIKLPQLIDFAQKENMQAIAVTDTNNLFGALEFAEQASKKGIQPIIGCAVTLKFTGDQFSRDIQEQGTAGIVVLVQNKIGYQNLLKIISDSYLENPDTDAFYVDSDLLEKYNHGLILLSGGATGPLGKLFLEKKASDAEVLCRWFHSVFGDRFYLELMRHGCKDEYDTEPFFLDLAASNNIPIVATNNAYFVSKDMYEAHDALICVAEGTYVNVTERRRLNPSYYLKSSYEMEKAFQDLPEAIENTGLIAKRCAFHPESAKPMLPTFPSDAGRNEEEELRFQAHEGLLNRLEKHVYTPEMDEGKRQEILSVYQKRLEHELTIILQMGFPGYFLIVADFIKWAKAQSIPVGPGRGSGAGSLVAWSLTITDIDPIRFNLLFERFLNPERVSMPDFDVDFCQDRRDEVIQYVQERYGRDKVAQIITFGKLQARAVLRDVGRVLQMPYGQVDRLCKLVPNNPANPVTLAEALVQEPALRQEQRQDATVAKLIDIALKLEGLYRHASTHAAGIIIGDRPLQEIVPLYRDPKSDMPVTQFNMKFVEKAGLVKFDFLGLKTLTIIEKSAEMVRQREGKPFSISTVSLEDKATFALLRNVDTSGVFQLESAGMRDVLRRLKPDRFEEIIALVALYRPGPMDDIPRYLACKHGEEEVQYMHEMLEDILKESFGVMVYQEQVMQIAQKMAGYTMGGADLLRRAMGKKIKAEMDAQRKIFIDGAVKNKVPNKLADQIFDQIAKFAGYGFNKSHSAPYGLIAYQTAYMKANYPAEFMAATLTYDMGNTDKLSFYRQELTKMGIALVPPHVNTSDVMFTVKEGAIHYALAAIRNVGGQAAEDIVMARQQEGPFKDIWDFLSRVSARVLNKRQMEFLVRGGALDNLGMHRGELLAHMDRLIGYGVALNETRSSQQSSLFGDDAKDLVPIPTLTKIKKWSAPEQLEQEFDAIGFYLSAHPLETYTAILASQKVVQSDTFSEMDGKRFKTAGIVMAVQRRTSKQGKSFAFVTLSDQGGQFEVTLFSETLDAYGDLLQVGEAVIIDVSAKIEQRETDDVRLIGYVINRLQSLLSKVDGKIELELMPETTNITPLYTLLSGLQKGTVEIEIVLNHQNKKVRVTLPYRIQMQPTLEQDLLLPEIVKAVRFI